MSSPCTDLDLERAYVATLLQHPDERHLASASRLSPLDCASADYGRVLGVLHELQHRGEAIGEHEVRAQLERAHAPARVLEALRALSESSAIYSPLDHVAGRLGSLARARRKREHHMRAISACERMHLEAADECAREALSESAGGGVEVVSAHATVATAMHQLCTRGERGVYRSGFPRLDSAIGGFPPGTLTVVGGVTGAGKSSLLLAIAVHLSRHGHRVGIVSCEDPEAVWGPRVLAHLVDVNAERFYDERITEDFLQTCRDGMAAARQLGIQFAYKLNRPLDEVTAAIRALVSEHGCSVIMVDYIQAIQFRGDDLRIAVGKGTQAIKSECQAANVPLILASQLRRADSSKPYAEPHANALKEAGELENKSEIVLLLWKTSDEEDARVLGKVAKVKWTPKRPRFEVQRSPRTGAITGLVEPSPQDDKRPARGGFLPDDGGWRD